MNRALEPHRSGRPLVIAHRGGAAEAPENTLAAFQRAGALDLDGVECDVRLSRDGVPVVIHDGDVVVSPGSASVPVARLSAAELVRVDTGTARGKAPVGEAPPLLSQVLALPWDAGYRLMIELKPGGDESGLARAVARVLAGSERAGQCVLASFSPAILAETARLDAGLPLMGLLDTAGGAADFQGIPVSAWGVDRALVTTERVARWSEGGKPVWSWTVKRLDQVPALVQAGVSALITDIPTAVRAAVR